MTRCGRGDAGDLICGGRGDDLLSVRYLTGVAGDVVQICGGEGNDGLRGSLAGADLYGGDGNDTLEGFRSANLLMGGAGNDLIVSTGTDTLQAGAGDDRVINLITGRIGTLDGGLGDDLLEVRLNPDGSSGRLTCMMM